MHYQILQSGLFHKLSGCSQCRTLLSQYSNLLSFSKANFNSINTRLNSAIISPPAVQNSLIAPTRGESSVSKSNFISQLRYASVRADRQAVDYLDCDDDDIFKTLSEDMVVFKDFITENEEKSLLSEVERYMKRLRYEYDHWGNAIHGFRETEKKSWNSSNSEILQRVKDIAFPPGVSPIAYVHVLDIAKEGYIKPHVDAVRFCGDTIAGLCLLSSCVMRLALEKDGSKYGDLHLPQRCLYIMKGQARYNFTHEVLKEEESFFKDQAVPRNRRISVICRNEPIEMSNQ